MADSGRRTSNLGQEEPVPRQSESASGRRSMTPSSQLPPQTENRSNPSSVSSSTGERSAAIPTAIKSFEAVRLADVGNPPPETWRPRLMEMWVRFPGHVGPVWGWHREGAGDLPDAFFSSDGDMRVIAREALARYGRAPNDLVKAEDEPHACRLHPLLHPAVRVALRNQHHFRDATRRFAAPIRTRGDWQMVLDEGEMTALTYSFTCTQCGLTRSIRRTNSLIAENLPADYAFRCADVEAVCHVASPQCFDFATNPLVLNTEPRGVPNYPHLPSSSLNNSRDFRISRDSATTEDEFAWRRRLKLCTNVPKFRGTDSPVLLATWIEAVEEALEEARVPPGRSQVNGASMFFADAAQKWWESRAGLRRNNTLATFQDLCTSLEKSFIPADAAARTIAKWNTLRQRGTVEEYLKEADELSLAHPLGEDGEFWQIWNGLRPELKFEVRYALKIKKVDTLPRAELRELLETVEVKYPPLRATQPRPFNPRFFRRAEAKTVQTAPRTAPPEGASPTICWVCDRAGHRAPECNRRKTSGCPRCGSKAHNLTMCPQRRTGGGRPPQNLARPAQKKTASK